MGNCAATRLAGAGLGLGCSGDDDPVSVCRERKRLIKAAVERRRALAAAHGGYIESLHSVADAIDQFILRHSAPAPILITLPPSSPTKPQALPFHRAQEDVETVKEEVAKEEEKMVENEQENQETSEMSCGYFFPETEMQMPAAAAPAPAGFEGWDFFNPFYGVQTSGEFCKEVEEDLEDLKALREKEGIPELEEAEEGEEMEKTVVDFEAEQRKEEKKELVNGGGIEEKGMVVSDLQENGRDLLEALKDVEGLFIRAYDSGKDVSKMLEATTVKHHSGLDEIKESPSKIMQVITWHRSPSSLSTSSSYRSQLGASSNSSASWADNKSDIFEEYGGMSSGSHSQTLGRLYAWEKKLYEEVKAGDNTRQAYEKKCLQLRNQDVRGDGTHVTDKTRNSVRDLYSRILVALRAIESISEKIQKLRDEELKPQLIELLQGLTRTWKVMLESHETQKQIMFEVNSFTCPAYGKFSNDAQRNATIKLEAELRNWRACFVTYMSAQKAYVETLDRWLSKFISPDTVYYNRTKTGAPPLVLICNEWVSTLGKLPDKSVSYAIRNFVRSVRVLWVKQGEEQQQKRRVDSVAKEIDRKVSAFKRAESKILETKLSEHKTEQDAKQRMEYLAERKEMLNSFRKRLEIEKVKHHDCMRETHDVTLNGFKIGLAGIFESLTEFSKDCLNLYDSLLAKAEESKDLEITTGKEESFIEGPDLSHAPMDGR